MKQKTWGGARVDVEYFTLIHQHIEETKFSISTADFSSHFPRNSSSENTEKAEKPCPLIKLQVN